ncbi:MAG: long-chain fatty acid--CoA ligase [Bacteroidales bacterium]|nr:long-chain fatty acid--CoA ligase [Bacteroidales bacterium]
MDGVTRIFDLLQVARHLHPGGEPVLYGKKNGEVFAVDSHTYHRNSHILAHALLDSGIKKGDRVATIINNRPEWNYFDMAISLIGAVQVPVYPTVSEAHISLIFNDAAISGLIVNNTSVWEKTKHIASGIASLKLVISIDSTSGITGMADLILKYEQYYPEKEIQEIARNIQAKDLFSIIYTSGTTGRPKGVMLTHENLVSNFLAISEILKQQPAHRAVSVLPLCHIYERILNYTYQNCGTSIWYIDGFDKLREDLAEAKPEIFCAVPRIMEKLYDAILSKGRDLKGIKKLIFYKAIAIGQQFEPGRKFSPWYNLQLELAQKLVFKKWKDALGGNLVSIVSGGASLNPRISRTLWAAGFKIMEGYGLTETSPVVAVSNFLEGGVKIGTVGPVLPGVDIKFAEDGEILVRGPNVMSGYYNRPDRTAEVIDTEGWFHTGDIGHLVDNKFLQITDRKKEIFKTSGGKYIAPQVLENRFKESAFIDHILVIGENRKHPSAIIVPAFEYLKGWCRVKEIPYYSDDEIICHSRVISRIEEEIYEINQHFGHHEQIKKWEIISDKWTVESGELSPTLKLRRKHLTGKYARLIDEMYKNP